MEIIIVAPTGPLRSFVFVVCIHVVSSLHYFCLCADALVVGRPSPLSLPCVDILFIYLRVYCWVGDLLSCDLV